MSARPPSPLDAAAPRPAVPGAASEGRGATLMERAGVVAVLALALALRLWHLGARSIWTDEGSTWTAASAPLHELIRLCAEKDASPPLFYLLTAGALKLGAHLPGAPEAWLRLVSALASTVMVWLAYRLVRLFESRGVALLAATLAALGPYSVMYAQEARTYTLVAMFATASLYCFVRAAVLERRHAWPHYVLVTTLGLYTQILVVLGLGVQAVLALALPGARRRLKPWLGALAVCVALYLPWLFISVRQMAHLGSSHWYMRPPGPREIVQVLRAVFLTPVSLVQVPAASSLPGLAAWLSRPVAAALVVLVPAVALAMAAVRASGRDGRATLARIAWLGILLPLAAVLAAAAVKPLWNTRYFVLVTPLTAALFAVGLASIRPRALAATWTALTLLLLVYACARYDLDATKEPWRAVAARIDHEQSPGRTAVLVTFDVDPFRFYGTRMARPPAMFELSHPDVPFADRYSARQLDELAATARARTRPFDEVWVIVRSPNSPQRREVAERGQRVAGEGRLLVEQGTWASTGGPLFVTRYRRMTPAPR